MNEESQSQGPQEVNDDGEKTTGTDEVLVNPAYPEQLVMIGKNFSKEGRKGLIELLRKNKDIFAWQLSDMTGVPRWLINHRLNVNMMDTPVAQKKRSLSAEKN